MHYPIQWAVYSNSFFQDLVYLFFSSLPSYHQPALILIHILFSFHDRKILHKYICIYTIENIYYILFCLVNHKKNRNHIYSSTAPGITYCLYYNIFFNAIFVVSFSVYQNNFYKIIYEMFPR